jgi:hypothetical protein
VLTHLQDASFHAKRGLAEMSELQAGVVASAGDFQLSPSTREAAGGLPAEPHNRTPPLETLPGSVFNTNKEK